MTKRVKAVLVARNSYNLINLALYIGHLPSAFGKLTTTFGARSHCQNKIPSETVRTKMSVLISVIVTTYNWPEALEACLNSLFAQTDRNFEIIIADDGSGFETSDFISRIILNSPITIRHISQEDLGFRAATIRNKAALASHGRYLLFLDGDCVALPTFISRHRKLAEPGYFVPGNRILINRHYTAELLTKNISVFTKPLRFFLQQRVKGNINRFLPLFKLPWNTWRYLKPRHWKNAMTCNLAMWKDDFLAVNGFDESFEGWGYEDSDLIIRLIHSGIKRKEGRFAVPVLHLWHPHNDRIHHDENYQRLISRVDDKDFILALKGTSQYALNDDEKP